MDAFLQAQKTSNYMKFSQKFPGP